MMSLKGNVNNETDKAILFEIMTDECGFHLAGKTLWFPKAKIKMPKKLKKIDIKIHIPNWLYDSNIIINENER